MPWKIVSDTKVRHIWRDTETDEEHIVPPTYYSESGTPINPENGDDMEYVRTEVFE